MASVPANPAPRANRREAILWCAWSTFLLKRRRALGRGEEQSPSPCGPRSGPLPGRACWQHCCGGAAPAPCAGWRPVPGAVATPRPRPRRSRRPLPPAPPPQSPPLPAGRACAVRRGRRAGAARIARVPFLHRAATCRLLSSYHCFCGDCRGRC